MTTRWSETNRVWYCEEHDSMVRQAIMRDNAETAQCDRALILKIPLIVEECDIKLADLFVPATDLGPSKPSFV